MGGNTGCAGQAMSKIEILRQQIKSAVRAGDMDRAWYLCRIVVGLRVCEGEIPVRLRPPRWQVVESLEAA